MLNAAAWRSPSALVFGSCGGAALALIAALQLTRGHAADDWQSAAELTITPERAAESFVDAFRAQAYARAASFATGSLAHAVQARARANARQPEPANAPDRRRFVLQESQWLRHERLRLIGVLIEDGEDESAGQTVALTLMRRDHRYYVEDVEWDEPTGDDQ